MGREDKASKMNLITLDFETFWAQDFTLRKLTTEEYIRSDKFQIIGVAVKVNDTATTWHTGTHESIKAQLASYPWSESVLVCHNTMFDGAILKWVLDIDVYLHADTLSMARAIYGIDVGGSLKSLAIMHNIGQKGVEVDDAKGKRLEDFTPQDLAQYGAYCINDVELTYKLFKIFIPKFPHSELSLIDMTLRMFIEPVFKIDDVMLEERLEEVKVDKQLMLSALKSKLGCDSDEAVRKILASNNKFAGIIEELGVVVPTKISAKTGKKAYALAKTDLGFIELSEHEEPLVQQLCAVRLGTKSTIEESRLERFIGIGQRNRGYLPIPLKYYGAHTGRWAGCVVADTQITVYDEAQGVTKKHIVDVLLSDLVWDGEEFVIHEGVVFTGYSETITWDGITGTEDHVVFTEEGEISLYRAMQGQHRITVANSVTKDAVDSARRLTSGLKKQTTL